MEHELRAAIAFICGSRFIKTAIRLYDDHQGKYIPYNIQRNKIGFNWYDYDRKTYLNGNDSYIYDYQTKTYTYIVYTGNCFSGTHCESNTNFTGVVTGGLICITEWCSNECKTYSYHIH